MRESFDSALQVEEVARFHRTGWTIKAGLFREEASIIRQWTDEVIKLPPVAGRQMVYFETSSLDFCSRIVQRIENFCPYHEGFNAITREGKLQHTLEHLLEDEALLFKDKINFKLSGGSGYKLHQDQQAGWSKYAPIFINVLVAIDRCTIENGCLELADMPRLDKMLRPERTALSESDVAPYLLTPRPLEAGDALFFDSFVPHSSKPNLTSQSRRSLYLTFNRKRDGDHRSSYFHDKRISYPPDAERDLDATYAAHSFTQPGSL